MSSTRRHALLIVAVALVLGVGFMQLVRSDGESYQLTAKYTKGEKWYVLSELSNTVTLTRRDRNGAEYERKVLAKRIDSYERIHDNVDDAGVLAGMTVNVLKSATVSAIDDAKPVETKTAINGRKILLSADSKIPAKFADGAGEAVSRDDFSPCEEFLLLLPLPPKPVAKGDTWQPDTKELIGLLLKGQEARPAAVTARCRLEDVVARDGCQVAVVTLALSAKTEAGPDFSWEYELVRGTLEFNITSGRPVRLDLEGKGKLNWRQLGADNQELATFTANIESSGLKITYGTSDFVLPPKDDK